MAKDALAKYALELNASLQQRRGAIEGEIEELNRLVVPDLDLDQARAGNGFDTGIPSHYRDDLQETTACEVHETLQNGLMAHLTPIGTQWTSLQPADESEVGADAKHWLHYAGQTLLRLMGPSTSNFYVALSRSYSMDGGFGTSVIIPRLSSNRRLVFDSLPMLTYSLSNDADGVPSTMSRSYKMSAANMFQMFGADTPPKIGIQAHDPNEKNQMHRVVHLIEPNLDRNPRKNDPKNQPFRSIYVHEEEEETIRNVGYFEQPHAVGIWKESLTGPYGVSPFSRVLPDIRQLQNLSQNRAILVERSGNPPWYLPAGFDGKFDPRPFGVNIPGGRGSADDLMPREMQTNGRLDYLQAEAAEKMQSIKNAGFYDLFRMLTTSMDTTKTAYEVRELMGEKATLFHPFYARKTQQLTQVIRRSLAIAIRAGLIAPPPKELLERLPGGAVGMKDPEIHYNSKLARALELSETNALLATTEALLPLAGQDGLASPLFDWLKPAEIGPKLAMTYGVSSDVIASPQEIAMKQKARADAAEQQKQMAIAQAATQGVRDLGGVGGVKEAAEAIEI